MCGYLFRVLLFCPLLCGDKCLACSLQLFSHCVSLFSACSHLLCFAYPEMLKRKFDPTSWSFLFKYFFIKYTIVVFGTLH